MWLCNICNLNLNVCNKKCMPRYGWNIAKDGVRWSELGLLCLTPLSTIFHLHSGGLLFLGWKPSKYKKPQTIKKVLRLKPHQEAGYLLQK